MIASMNDIGIPYPHVPYGSMGRMPIETERPSILDWHHALARAPRGVQVGRFVMNERIVLVVDGGRYVVQLKTDYAELACSPFALVRRYAVNYRTKGGPKVRWLTLDEYVGRMVQLIVTHRLAINGCYHPLPQVRP